MEPWYKVALPRAEVREGRSFNPSEFAIALEQIVAGRGTASRSTDAAIEDAKALETVEKALYREKKTLKEKPRCVWLARGVARLIRTCVVFCSALTLTW
jgi:hypothetical protein